MKKYAYTVKAAFLGMLLGMAPCVQADSLITVRHLVNEQNIVSLNVSEEYLLLPIQENAPESKIGIIKNNKQEGTYMNVRLAREKVDYYMPLSLSAYKGQHISIDVQGLPESAICWKELKMSDSFDLANREAFRPVYHHTPAYGWMNDPNGMFYKDGVYHCISSIIRMVPCGETCIGDILPVQTLHIGSMKVPLSYRMRGELFSAVPVW